MTFDVDDMRDRRHQGVVDTDGAKIGIVGRHRLTFTPLGGARVALKHVPVTADKKLVEHAAAIDTDGELTTEAEPGLFLHCGIAYTSGGDR